MKLLTPTTKEEFLFQFEQYSNSGNCYFRGQADSSWDITPGLARNKDKNIYTDIIEIEENLASKFKAKIIKEKLTSLIPTIKNHYHESWQWLMASQHYGLPTRLLDFSHDKYTALQFATADLPKLNADGALIIYCNASSIQEDVNSPILKEKFKPLEKTFFFQVPIFVQHDGNEDKLGERRKMIQGSKFLYRETSNITKCLALDTSHSDKLVKIHIPKELKLSIIEDLIEKGRFAFDIYAGENNIDFYAAIIKNEFLNLDTAKVNTFFKIHPDPA